MSKESDNKAIIGRWFDTAPNFEAETIEAPVRFHDWIEYRSLTPDQRQGPKQDLIRRGQAACARAVHDLGGAVLRALHAAAGGGRTIIRALARAVLAAAGKWWRVYNIRCARIAAVRELHALDDRTLRDIGVSRSEIEWVVVHGRDAPQFYWAPHGREVAPHFEFWAMLTWLGAWSAVNEHRRGSRNFAALPEARARVDRFLFGTPVGFPVQFPATP
jgi:uncharacterized protein YjiS (DUF1127 family)